MTEYQKFEKLWAKFCLLGDMCGDIILQHGSFGNWPPNKKAEYIQLGKEQEFVQQEINKLFAINGGGISN